MYNAHRGMIPQPNNRLNELFEQLRQEFDNQSRAAGDLEHFQCFCNVLCPEADRDTVNQQVSEMENIRNKIYQLEQTQMKIKQESVDVDASLNQV